MKPISDINTPSDMSAFWMPFTANQQFKAAPRILKSAEGMYYHSEDGRKILDGTAGLWCCNAGHGRREIAEAVSQQISHLDFAPTFQMGHPLPFELANQLVKIAPQGFGHVFYTNSGSECADTALKMVRAYWRLKGQATKTKLIGRARGYHGVNIAGTSLGGIGGNRKMFGQMMDADHLPHTLQSHLAFTKGMAATGGVELANELLKLIELHDASNIAAVIVEPMSGSAGVIVPPVGYLQRLREICTQHNILLIFDEVITAYGRMGKWTGAEFFGVVPDIMNTAKQVTNGAIPLGAVIASSEIYNTFMNQAIPEHMVEFGHGYTYSGHPVACAAGLATLELLKRDNLIEQSAALAPIFEEKLHSLKGSKHVVDIRNCGLAGAIQIAPRDGDPVIRPFEAGIKLWNAGFYVRFGGDTLQFGPTFNTKPEQLDSVFNAVGDVLNSLD